MFNLSGLFGGKYNFTSKPVRTGATNKLDLDMVIRLNIIISA